jgi:TatD DNase family protein
MISIGGPVTWVGNRKATEPAKVVPIENLLIETDSPFLTPEPFCNKKNSPVFLEYIARKVAELRGISYEALTKATLDNGVRFYGIG